MADQERLRIAMGLIIKGLYEKEYRKVDGKYEYSRRFIHGMNVFEALKMKYSPKNSETGGMHEQKFITEYAMRPVAEWFTDWEHTEELKLEEQMFYGMGALAGDSGFGTFHVSEECEDYIAHFEKDMIGGMEQRIVYEKLRQLKQEEYVELRRFFIENPIVEEKKIRNLKLKYAQNEIARSAIQSAYEVIQEDCCECPKCGWTMKKERGRIRCQGRSCEQARCLSIELKEIKGDGETLRLRRGVMKYLAVPGILELEIVKHCKKWKVQSELWPEMDLYDVKITFPRGEVWAIDAKAVHEPYFLRQKIREDGGFPAGDYEKGLYVIPDEIVKEVPDYKAIINSELKNFGDKRIRCVSLRDLKREIRKRSAEQ